MTFWPVLKHTTTFYVKTAATSFGPTFGKIGLLFIPTFGHTGEEVGRRREGGGE